MGETAFDPLRDSISAVGHQHGCDEQSGHERNQSVAGEMNPLPDLRRGRFGEGAQLRGEENSCYQENSKSADIENSLDGPYRNLRGERQVLAAGYQIGTNQLAGAAKQGESCEADYGGREQSPDWGLLAHGLKKNFPAYCPQEIGEIDEGHTVDDVTPV